MSYKHLIFVYGTLKRNEPNHDKYIKNPPKGSNIFVSTGELISKLPLVIASRHNVPYLLDHPGLGHHVQGEVYQVDDDMLSLLDEIEDAPRYYKRKLEFVRISDTVLLQCWLYKLDNFKPEMLNGPFLRAYSSRNFPYTESLDTETRSMDYYKDVMKS